MSVSIIRPGTKVTIGGREFPISATVVAVCMRGEECSPTYQVAYWAGELRMKTWLSPSELTTRSKKCAKIGFLAEGTP